MADKPPTVMYSEDAMDLRTPTAQARDEWLESEEGRRCTQPGFIKTQYLRNRLIRAFVAGYDKGRAEGIEAAAEYAERGFSIKRSKSPSKQLRYMAEEIRSLK